MDFIEILRSLQVAIELITTEDFMPVSHFTSLSEALELDEDGCHIFAEIFEEWVRTVKLFASVGASPKVRVRDLCILMRPLDKSKKCVSKMEQYCAANDVLFPPFDSQLDMAKRLAGVPTMQWKYKWETVSLAQTHTGVMAQTFHALFPSTSSDKVIEPVDIIGQLLNLAQVHEQQIVGMQVEMGKMRQQIEGLANKK